MNVDAIARVARAVEGTWHGQALSLDALRCLPKGPWRAGWRYGIDVAGERKNLDLVLDGSFPWSPPRIYLRRPPPLGTLPHLEADGFVCVLPGRTPADPQDPIGIVQAYLREAISLADKWNDPNWVAQEFSREFLSYLDTSNSVRPIRSLDSPTAYELPGALVWRGQSYTLLSRTKPELLRWLANSSVVFRTKPVFEPAIVLVLPNLPDPTEMPRTARDLLNLSDRLGHRLAFTDLLLGDVGRSLVALSLPTTPHSVMVAYDIPAPPTRDERRRRSVYAGFRPAKMPAQVMLDRRGGAAVKVKPYKVTRLDPDWVHGRDSNQNILTLQGKRVVLIGCGSLGSGAAMMLAKAGVGQFDLVDPEQLDSENVSRHELGLDYVGWSKAGGLVERLAQAFSHLQRLKGHRLGWRSLVDKDPNVLLEADLLVVTIGAWSDEGALEHWRCGQTAPPPTVFGWLEPFAAAGHAVILDARGPCFGCGLDRFGQSTLKVVDWQGATTSQVHPACGGAFQPYGAGQLAHVQSLVAEASLDRLLGRVSHQHRIWSAAKRTIERDGGRWSEDWCAFAGSGVDHGGEYDRAWERRADCAICSTR